MASYHVKICLCSLSKANIDLSSSDGSLSSSEMKNYSLPTASTPRPADDTKVLSQRIPGQEEVVLETPQGETPDVGLMAGKIPMEFDEGGRSKLGPQPDTMPEPPAVPDSGMQHPAKGGEPPGPMTSVHPKASDNLVEALQAVI